MGERGVGGIGICFEDQLSGHGGYLLDFPVAWTLIVRDRGFGVTERRRRRRIIGNIGNAWNSRSAIRIFQ